MTGAAYAGFDHPAVAPLAQLDHRTFALELFHGPTLAFKDVAMQLLGRLFDHALARRGERVTIVGATSGDTGSAAIEACRDRAALDVVILHPEGRTSEVQRRQMTTVLSPNIRNFAIRGDFDDCQDLVKGMFNDAPFRAEQRLAAVNSINWARIAAQIPYYAFAALALGAPDRPVAFSVPTGNFGNVFAAWAARRMGLPVERLIVGANRNDILARFLAANDMSVRGVEPSLSPSHGHPGLLQFRAPAVRAAGPRRRGHAKPRCSASARRAACRCPTRRGGGRRRCSAASPWTTRAPWPRSAACGTAPATSPTRTPRSAPPPPAPSRRRTRRSPWWSPPPPTRPSSRTRWSGPPAPGPLCRRRLADLYERQERYAVLAPDLAEVEAGVRAHTRRNAAAA